MNKILKQLKRREKFVLWKPVSPSTKLHCSSESWDSWDLSNVSFGFFLVLCVQCRPQTCYIPLNLWSFCLHLPNARITSTCHFSESVQCCSWTRALLGKHSTIFFNGELQLPVNYLQAVLFIWLISCYIQTRKVIQDILNTFIQTLITPCYVTQTERDLSVLLPTWAIMPTSTRLCAIPEACRYKDSLSSKAPVSMVWKPLPVTYCTFRSDFSSFEWLKRVS